MKHLRYFNENKEQIIYMNYKQYLCLKLHNMEEFCKNYLAYLIDDGFKINVVSRYYNEADPSSFNSTLSDSEYRISIKNSYSNLGTRNKKFTWDSVKDDIIPFFEILNEKYKINDIKFITPKENKTDSHYPEIIFNSERNTINDIVGSEITFLKEILKILIIVEEK